MQITSDSILFVLRPWLGSMFLAATSFVHEVEILIRDFKPNRSTLLEFRNRLESFFLTGISKATRNKMCVILDNYQSRYLSLADIYWMTDDVIGIVLERFLPFSGTYSKIKEFAMQTESLSALRILFLKYRDYISEEDLVFFVAFIKRTYLPEQFSSWLYE